MILQPVIYYLVLPLMCVALVLSFLRMMAGPTLADRIVAFDLITTVAAGFIVILAIANRKPVLLDVASVWAIVSFLGTIGFAYYIEKWRGRP